MKHSFWKSPETIFAIVCLILGGLAFVFLGSLVAEPKLLFGRSLTAIPPALFPSMVLVALCVLCVLHLGLSFWAQSHAGNDGGLKGWQRGAVFFAIMTVYALVMGELGFITSSAIAIAVMSWFIGNRSIVQILLVAILAPLLLYLAATRLLAVSLPELDIIQRAIAQVFDMFSASSVVEPEVSQ